MKTTKILALTTTLLASSYSIHAQTVFDISDTFQIGTPGSNPLDGAPTSEGKASWTTTENLLVKRDGKNSSVTTKDARVYCASVPLPSTKGVITVTGDVKPDDGAERKNWVAVGLGTNNLSFTWEQGLFMLIDSGGYFEGFVNTANKDRVRLIRGKVPGYEAGFSVKVAIEYDPATNTVKMAVNGTQVLEPKQLPVEQTPKIEAAGFSGFAPTPGTPSVFGFRVFSSNPS